MCIRPRPIAAAAWCPASRRDRSNTRPTPPARSPTWCSAARPRSSPTSAGSSPTRGGTLPFLTGRFVRLAEERKPAHLPNGPLPEFQKFYYELAQGNTPGQIAALLKMVPVSQVLYGTDYPFRDGAEVNQGIADWGFGADDLRAIEHENARKLLPRLKAG